jgi:inosine/xanthosine triphosphate pyrophosphatase family protein
MLRQRQWCRIAALAVLLLLPACREEESRWDAVQEATEGQTTSTVEDAIDGSVFNQFFPKQGEGFDIVFKQEKEGFAQASLQEGGK